MIVQALLLGLVTAFGYADDFFGASMLQRPIVLAPLVGLILGDFQQGIIIGANLELIWMGVVIVGAAIPMDIKTGSVLGTAFAIMSGSGTEVALALAVPISLLAQIVENGMYVLRAGFIHKADRYAEEGDCGKIERLHIGSFLLIIVAMGAITTVSILLGADVMNGFIDKIPPIILDALQAASSLLPALGFALLMSLIITKKLAAFYFLGFIAAVYGNIPVIAVAGIGVIIAIILHNFGNYNDKKYDEDEEDEDDE
ncbi:PTS sugar transporter [Clostridium tertium]|uniref:N-acetylgalactosamine permease IIC component 1 n=1 Tax=Clostridium tertium TaxID=1559 RepID=A0A6N3G3L0_9CLOT